MSVVKLRRRRLSFLSAADLQHLTPAEQASLQGLSGLGPKPSPRRLDGVVYRIITPELEPDAADAVTAATQPAAKASAERGHGQVSNPRTHSRGAIEYLSKPIARSPWSTTRSAYQAALDLDERAGN